LIQNFPELYNVKEFRKTKSTNKPEIEFISSSCHEIVNNLRDKEERIDVENKVGEAHQ